MWSHRDDKTRVSIASRRQEKCPVAAVDSPASFKLLPFLCDDAFDDFHRDRQVAQQLFVEHTYAARDGDTATR